MPITSDMQMIPPLWRKQRTKEPLVEGERGEWKSWLKTQHLKNEDHGIWSHHFMANRWEKVTDFNFWGSKITADDNWSHEIRRRWLLGRKVMKKSYGRKVMLSRLDSILKKRHYFTNRSLSSQGYGFSSSHVWMWELACKESWAPKNWYFWTVVLEKTLWECLELRGDQTSQS